MKTENYICLRLSVQLRTKQELAHLLQISYSTLLRRIKKAGIKHGPNLLSPAEQENILAMFGFTVDWLPGDHAHA